MFISVHFCIHAFCNPSMCKFVYFECDYFHRLFCLWFCWELLQPFQLAYPHHDPLCRWNNWKQSLQSTLKDRQEAKKTTKILRLHQLITITITIHIIITIIHTIIADITHTIDHIITATTTTTTDIIIKDKRRITLSNGYMNVFQICFFTVFQ